MTNKHNVKLICQTFTKTMSNHKKGDVFYCDPPYVPASSSKNFVSYHGKVFTESDQIDLLNCSLLLSQNKIPVLISNSKASEYLYRKYCSISDFSVNRYVGGKNASRGAENEIIATFPF